MKLKPDYQFPNNINIEELKKTNCKTSFVYRISLDEIKCELRDMISDRSFNEEYVALLNNRLIELGEKPINVELEIEYKLHQKKMFEESRKNYDLKNDLTGYLTFYFDTKKEMQDCYNILWKLSISNKKILNLYMNYSKSGKFPNRLRVYCKESNAAKLKDDIRRIGINHKILFLLSKRSAIMKTKNVTPVYKLKLY